MYKEKPRSNKWVIVLIVLGAVGLSGLCCCGGLGWWLYSAAEAPSNITYNLNAPAQVEVGQTVTLTVEVTNTDSDVQKLVDVDIYDSYLDGFVLVGSDPPYAGSSNVFGMTTLNFGLDIPAGGTQTIEIELRAANTGIWRGDVDVTIGNIMSFITQLAQTEVVPAGTTPGSPGIPGTESGGETAE